MSASGSGFLTNLITFASTTAGKIAIATMAATALAAGVGVAAASTKDNPVMQTTSLSPDYSWLDDEDTHAAVKNMSKPAIKKVKES